MGFGGIRMRCAGGTRDRAGRVRRVIAMIPHLGMCITLIGDRVGERRGERAGVA